MIELIVGAVGVGLFVAALGIRTVKQRERGLIERFGKFNRYADSGFHWIIPGVDRMMKINITEQIANVQSQEIITKDNLNATVDAQIYYRVPPTEDTVKKAVYEVNDVDFQIVSLAQTTLRNIIGGLKLTEANTQRDAINSQLMTVLSKETKNWGISIVRAELKEINPPEDVQNTMNKIVIAENEKRAALDFATATETKADGSRRAAIKEAEGIKQAKILSAEGEAQSIKLVNEAANKYFTGNAVALKKLDTVVNALSQNSTIVVPNDGELVNVIGNLSGVLPIKKKKDDAPKDKNALIENIADYVEKNSGKGKSSRT